MALALFDLDETLIKGDCSTLWSREMVRLGWVDGALFMEQDTQLMSAYCEGKLAMEDYMAFSLVPMAGRRESEVAERVADFVRRVIAPVVYQEARKTIDTHRAIGDMTFDAQ